MRMSTVQIFNQGMNNLLDRQADVTKTQEQLAAGRRIMDASEDPAGTARMLNITLISLVSMHTSAIPITCSRSLRWRRVRWGLSLRDLQRVRELTVQGNNAAMSAADRRLIGAEISGIWTRWLTQPIRRMQLGNIFLRGFQADVQPFARTAAGVTYSGDDGERFLQVASGMQIQSRDSGNAVFMSATAGNGSFDYRGAAGNTGNAVVTATSAASNYVPETYTLAFIQANASDPVTYTVTGDVSGPGCSGCLLRWGCDHLC